MNEDMFKYLLDTRAEKRVSVPGNIS